MSGEAGQRLILSALAESGADLVIIGGHAVAVHGHERGTRDVDLVYSTDRRSCSLLAGCLSGLGAQIMFADRAGGARELDADYLAEGGIIRLATDHGPLDAVSEVSGLDYGALASSAVEVPIGEAKLRVAGFEQLLQMKSAAGRPQDQADMLALREIREERD